MSLFNKAVKKVGKSFAPKSAEDYISYIEKTFYSDYPKMPFISHERDFEDWMQRVGTFPEQMLVPRKNMVENEDGVLPGHVYLLYWLEKQKTEKAYPGYFEYAYGIDPEHEVLCLQKVGLLNNNRKLTDKGWDVLRKHWNIVLDRTPKAMISETSNTFVKRPRPKENLSLGSEKTRYQMKERISETECRGEGGEKYYLDPEDYPLLDADLSRICNLTNAVLKKLGITHLLSLSTEMLNFSSEALPFDYKEHKEEIDYQNWINALGQGFSTEQFNKMSQKQKDRFGGREEIEANYEKYEMLPRAITHVVKTPLTKTGKKAKYPQQIALSNGGTFSKDSEEIFGSISYLQDGQIGAVKINWWGDNTKVNHINLGIVDGTLRVKTLSAMKPGDSHPTELYDYMDEIDYDKLSGIESEKKVVKVKVKVKGK